MSGAAPAQAHHSWVPWWIDPYSDNPIAFGVLFMLLIVLLFTAIFLYREIFITDPGAHPIHLGGLMVPRWLDRA